MKIVQYMSRIRLEDGGVVRAVLDLCGALAARGHDVTLLSLDATDVPQPWLSGDPGRPRVELIERQIGVLPHVSCATAERVRRSIQHADLVHLHVPWDPLCLQLGRLARRAGKPYVVSLHGMLDDWCMAQKGFKKRLYLAVVGRRFLERAAAVHCTADAERDQSYKWYPRGRPIVVPLIFDLSAYEDLPGPELARRTFASAFGDSGDAVVLFLSRLHPIKGLELLIQAAEQLRDDGLAFKLLIAGAGDQQYDESMRRLVQRLGLSERVAFLGFVSGRTKVSLYQAADVFVLPTSHENWGFVSVESLACGTPIIITRGVDIWPELESSGGAVIVDSTPQAIAAAIATLLGHQSRRQSMQQKGRAWVLQNLSLERVLGQYEQAYRCLIT